jgi:uncharacterized protein (TIGR00251 family)
LTRPGDLADLLDGTDGDAVVHVHVQPRAGRNEITGRHGNALRVRVQAPPVDGRATAAVGRLLGDAFGVGAGSVTLVSGDRSRLKRFRLSGIGRDAALATLESLLSGPGGGSPG